MNVLVHILNHASVHIGTRYKYSFVHKERFLL